MIHHCPCCGGEHELDHRHVGIPFGCLACGKSVVLLIVEGQYQLEEFSEKAYA